jgi:hypothetical protein
MERAEIDLHLFPSRCLGADRQHAVSTTLSRNRPIRDVIGSGPDDQLQALCEVLEAASEIVCTNREISAAIASG